MTRRDDRARLVYDVVRRLERGESIRQISRAKGIARKTVRKIARKNAKRRSEGDNAMARAGVKPRAPRPSKLDKYVETIDSLLDDYPDITAQRVFEELVLLGFDGGYTIVKEYVRKARPKEAKRAFDPVVTPPGKQAQVDWSPYTFDRGDDIEAFSAVLHYSRYQHADFSADRRQHTLFRHIVHAFDAFGGVPHELVFDSEKTVVDRWELGEPVLNLGMVDFAAYYRFAVHIAPRADGPYKGGVERPFWFLETNFFNGRTFQSLDEARETLAWWLENRANCRKHRTTRRLPLDMLAEERPLLKELPAHPYDTSEICWRIADGFHRVEFETNTYTVPRAYVGFRLCVRATENTVQVYDGYARLLATHERAHRGAHEERELPEHRRQRRIDIDKVAQRFEIWGDAATCFAARLRQRQRYAGVELSSILAFQAQYRLKDVLGAIEQALAYHVYKASAVKRILEVNAQPLRFEDVVAEQLRAEIRRTLERVPVRQRALDTYQQLLTTSRSDEQTSKENHEQETPPNDTDTD